MAKPQAFSEKQKDEIFEQARTFWDKSTLSMQDFFRLVDDAEKMWRVQLPDELAEHFKAFPDRAQLAPADIYINLKSLRSGLRNLLFSRKPFARLSKQGRPSLRDEQIQKAEWQLQTILDMESNGKGFESEADKANLQAMLAGITAVFTHWVRRTERVPLRDENTKKIVVNDKGEVVFKEEVVAEYPETKHIDIRRVRIDPEAETRETIKTVGYHYLSTLEQLERLNDDPNTDYDFDFKELSGTSLHRALYYEYVRAETDAYPDKGDENTSFGDKIVEVWDIRGLFRFTKPDGTITFEDLTVEIGNRTTQLRIVRNNLPIKGWELFDFPSIETDSSRLYTMGLVEPVMDMYIEEFLRRNQSLDESTRRTYDRYIGDMDACQDMPDQLEDAPGKIYKVNMGAAGLTDVRQALAPIPRPAFGQDTFQQAASIRQEVADAMGRNDFVTGTDPDRKETATAVNALVSGANSGLAQIANNLKDTFYAPVYRKKLILWDFFKGHEQNLIHDEQGNSFTINPGELSTFYKVDIDIKTQLDQPSMTRRFVETFPALSQNPRVDQHSLTKTMIDVLQLPNPEQLLPPNEYLQTLISRESALLMHGLESPVVSFDNDSQHIEGHTEAIRFVQNLQQTDPQRVATEKLTDKLLIQHNREHEESILRKQQGLGNTQKSAGGNAAALNNSESGAVKQRTGQGAGLQPQGRI